MSYSNFVNKEIIDLASTEFLSRLAYPSDIFDTLKHMNVFFQGPNSTISDFFSKLQAYLRKLDLWTTSIEAKQYYMFKDLSSLQHQHTEKLFQEIGCHLQRTDVSNPFFVDPSALPVGTGGNH